MGETSFGKYRLIAELGHGGMADVFLAVQPGPAGSGFTKLTVIKRLRQNLAEEPEFIAMLVDEARIAARLNHPNVVQTNEVGEVDSLYFIAMEYLDGQPFHRIQHRSGTRLKEGKTSPLTKSQQYLIVADVLAGLHHAHELADYDGTPLHIVHRDITPHNIFVTYEGQVKVVDFGIAKAAGRASETRQGVVKGKVRYMAPEQAVAQSVDRRADIFSVGILLWEAATGQRLWQGVDDLQIVQSLLRGEIQSSPRAIAPDVPEAIDAICRKALSRYPEDRYATAEEFRTALEQYLAESGELVPARRQLGPTVVELFNDKRAEIRSVIERQLAELNRHSSAEFKAVVIPSASPANSSANVSAASNLEDPPATPTSFTDQATQVYTPGRGRLRAVVLALVAATGVGGAVFVATTRKQVEPVPSAAAASPQPAASAPAPDLAKVSFSAQPGHATITIDDGPPRTLPYETQLKHGEYRLKVEAHGFVTKTETLTVSRDIATSFALERVPEKTADKAKSAPAFVPAVRAPAPQPRPEPQPTAAPATAAPAATTGDAPKKEPPKKKPGADPIDKTDPWGEK